MSFSQAVQDAAKEASSSTPPPPPAGFSSVDKSLPWYRRIKRTYLPNPGSYEEINNEAAMVLRPNIFDGVQFNLNAPLSPTFQIGHNVAMGSSQTPPGYAFSANYFSSQAILISRVDLSGRVSGRIFINHTPTLTSKIIADVGNQPPHSSRATWDLDYRGADYCAQLKVGNGTIAAVSYLQSVTPNLALGGEGFYQGKSRFSALTAAAKYTTEKDVATLTWANFGPVVMSYLRKVNERVSLAVEMFWDARSRESVVTAGYKFDLKQATVTGQVDSTGRIAAIVEEKINPGLSFLLSGEIDYPKNEYRFGFGVQIGG